MDCLCGFGVWSKDTGVVSIDSFYRLFSQHKVWEVWILLKGITVSAEILVIMKQDFKLN